MHVSQAKRVLARIRPERTLFHYFKDRYALLLLSWAADSGSRISDLRGGPLANLLRKPTVKRLLAGAGDGRVCPDRFLSHWPGLPYCYVLTLGLWGHECRDMRWNQTSRKGVNLVLQLNFTKSHDRRYARQIAGEESFAWDFHPVRTGSRNTIAWARIDYDEELGEALIEEIQSDWVRNALWAYDNSKREAASGGDPVAPRLHYYVNETLAPHIGLWSEATLAAALTFVRDDLRARTVWYHTWEGGKFLKDCEPPYSIYETLPRRFCFRRVREIPGLLMNERGRAYQRRLSQFGDRYEFWRLDL